MGRAVDPTAIFRGEPIDDGCYWYRPDIEKEWPERRCREDELCVEGPEEEEIGPLYEGCFADLQEGEPDDTLGP
jgi:hypothetical protein